MPPQDATRCGAGPNLESDLLEMMFHAFVGSKDFENMDSNERQTVFSIYSKMYKRACDRHAELQRMNTKHSA